MDFPDHLLGDGGGASLGAHLDELAVFFLCGDEVFAFGGVVAAGFFNVDVLAGLEGVDTHGGVPVVGGGDDEGVDVWVGEGLAEVAERFRAGCLLGESGVGSFVEVAFVDIDDVFDDAAVEAGELLDQLIATGSDAGDGDDDLVVGGGVSDAAKPIDRETEARGGKSGILQESTAVHSSMLHVSLHMVSLSV